MPNFFSRINPFSNQGASSNQPANQIGAPSPEGHNTSLNGQSKFVDTSLRHKHSLFSFGKSSQRRIHNSAMPSGYKKYQAEVSQYKDELKLYRMEPTVINSLEKHIASLCDVLEARKNSGYKNTAEFTNSINDIDVCLSKAKESFSLLQSTEHKNKCANHISALEETKKFLLNSKRETEAQQFLLNSKRETEAQKFISDAQSYASRLSKANPDELYKYLKERPDDIKFINESIKCIDSFDKSSKNWAQLSSIKSVFENLLVNYQVGNFRFTGGNILIKYSKVKHSGPLKTSEDIRAHLADEMNKFAKEAGEFLNAKNSSINTRDSETLRNSIYRFGNMSLALRKNDEYDVD